jgi:hypothetical protein
MAKQPSKFLSETAAEIKFWFVCACEDCDAEGELGMLKRDGMKPFNCPEGCGAVYVPYRPSLQWQLRCVVLPQYFPRQEAHGTL